MSDDIFNTVDLAATTASLETEAVAKEAARKAEMYTDKDLGPIRSKQGQLKDEIARLKAKGINTAGLENLVDANPSGATVGDTDALMAQVEGAVREAGGKELVKNVVDAVAVASAMVTGGHNVSDGSLFTAAVTDGLNGRGLEQILGLGGGRGVNG